MKARDLFSIIGGGTKIIIYDISTDNYVELWRGIVEDIPFDEYSQCGEREVQHLTVINGEDYLQIHV